MQCQNFDLIKGVINSQRLRVRKVKDLLLARHEQIKGSCKIFLVSDVSKNLNHQ